MHVKYQLVNFSFPCISAGVLFHSCWISLYKLFTLAALVARDRNKSITNLIWDLGRDTQKDKQDNGNIRQRILTYPLKDRCEKGVRKANLKFYHLQDVKFTTDRTLFEVRLPCFVQAAEYYHLNTHRARF